MATIQDANKVFRSYAKNLAVVYNRRKDVRAYLELLLSISVVIIFAVFAVRPTLVTIIQLNNEIGSKQETLSLLNQKISSLEESQSLYSNNRSLIELLDIAVPSGPLPARYSRQIEGVSKRARSSIINLSTNQVVLSGNTTADTLVLDEESTDRYPSQVSSLDYSIDIAGEYANITSFLTELDNLRRPMFVDTFSIRLADELEGEGLILSLSGRVPFLSKQ